MKTTLRDGSAHPVLVTGVGGNVGQGVIKSLRAGKLNYRIVGIDMEPMSAGFSLCDSHHTVPRTASSGFEKTLFSILEKEKPTAIYVCSPTELLYFSQNRSRIENKFDLCVFVNPVAVIDIGSDKLKTANFLRENGFPYPMSAMADDSVAVARIIGKYGFPILLKPRDGFTAKNVFIVDSLEKIEALNRVVPDLVAQRYLPDDSSEFTSGVIVGPDGKTRAVINLRRQLTQGTTYRTELVRDEAMDKVIIKFAETLGVAGVCNFQFRLDNGEPVIFEINPRFSGTSGIRYIYGLNEPEIVFELFRLGIERERPLLTDAVVLRYWNEIILPGATFKSIQKKETAHNGSQHIIRSGNEGASK